jgi:hypothetical protein
MDRSALQDEDQVLIYREGTGEIFTVPEGDVGGGGGGSSTLFVGIFASQSALETAHPSPASGSHAFVTATNTYWYWSGTAWTDSGESNLTGSLTTQVPQNEMVVKGSGDTLVSAGMRRVGNEIVSDFSIQTPSGSVRVGQNVRVSDNGGFLSVFAEAFDVNSFYTSTALLETTQEINDTTYGNGAARPRRILVHPARLQSNFPVDSQTNTTNSITFEYVTATNLFVRELHLRFNAAVNNVRLTIQRRQGDGTYRDVWESHTDGVFADGDGYNIVPTGANGDVTIDISGARNEVVNFGRRGERFRATLETSESVLPINGATFDIGLGAQFYPYLMIKSQDWRFVEVPNLSDANPQEFGDFTDNSQILTNSGFSFATLGTEVQATAQQTSQEFDLDEDDSGFTWTHADGDATLTSIRIYATNAKDNVLFTLSKTNDPTFKEVFRLANLAVGANTIALGDERVLRNGEEYRVDIFNRDLTTPTLTLKGSGATIAYDMRIKPLVIQNVAGLDDASTANNRTWSASKIQTQIDNATGAFVTPVITAFSSELQEVQNAGTSLTGAYTFAWTVSNPQFINGNLTLAQDGANLVTNLNPTAGTASVTITDVTLNAGDSTVFTLSGTDTQNNSFSRTYTVRGRQQEESAYWGTSATNNAASVSLGSLNLEHVVQDSRFEVNTQLTTGHFLIILVPEDRDATSIRELTFNQEAIGEFTKTDDARTIGSISYNAFVLENNGRTGAVDFRVTVS